ncbi:S-layer homology domain-containing protein [Chamaesiphon minutus]|uniref:Putative S-layer protein n=1 Tax=Chamaesiphon minutus (strain ATCC 27169 / PCC 6605) TaxID=1173020 RepID=K9UIT5_CHAP6|nr:S-layer homology domain-containing protein [Chamaesiphon minutus]AFY94336.1 putative S-layer protein [Chamaesiphon minutus PCC 6605]
MTQNNYPFSFKRFGVASLKENRFDRIVYLVIGSVSTGVMLSAGSVRSEPTRSHRYNLVKIGADAPLAKTIAASDNPVPVTSDPRRLAQANDIAGNWAEPFIKVLVEKDIIKGYPDGTFQPDRPVTRAEFSALLNKAFDLQPIRTERKFKDLPRNYWATDVIQKAYRSGFMAGYPGDTFAPTRNIIRIDSLVALVNGSKLAPTGNLDLNSVFGDAAQVPSYGQNALVAATQKCVAVSVEYDSSRLPGGNFGPNTVATRADVAAYIHQVLVGAGKLTPLDRSSPASKYIASCPQGVYVTSISDTTPRTTPSLSPDEAISKLSVPQLPTIPLGNITTAYPVNGLTTPSAFGASWGDLFIGASYQASTRGALYDIPPVTGQSRQDGAAYLGFGLGDARNFVGLETVATSYSTTNSGFLNKGSFSFKLHKQFGEQFAIAGGYENAAIWNRTPGQNLDGGKTGYGVASFVLNPDPNMGFFSNTTLSVGGGAGRFRSIGDIRNGKDSYGVFGSIGTRLSPNFSVVVDWNGQDIGVGLPIAVYLGDNTSLQLVPSVVDLANQETGGARFLLSGRLVAYNADRISLIALKPC